MVGARNRSFFSRTENKRRTKSMPDPLGFSRTDGRRQQRPTCRRATFDLRPPFSYLAPTASRDDTTRHDTLRPSVRTRPSKESQTRANVKPMPLEYKEFSTGTKNFLFRIFSPDWSGPSGIQYFGDLGIIGSILGLIWGPLAQAVVLTRRNLRSRFLCPCP